MPAFNDPARRSGAAKSKEEAEGNRSGEHARRAASDAAGSPAGYAQATEHTRIHTLSRRAAQPAPINPQRACWIADSSQCPPPDARMKVHSSVTV